MRAAFRGRFLILKEVGMEELTMAEVEEVNGGILFMVVPAYMCYSTVALELAAIYLLARD